MTQEEFDGIIWNRGNTVKLTNGKEYYVKGVKKKYLLLYSEEYEAYFVVDHRIIDCRTSDYIEPYVPKSKVEEEPQAPKAEAPKAEPIAVEPVVAEPVAAEPKDEQPKRKRKRIMVKRAVKVEI